MTLPVTFVHMTDLHVSHPDLADQGVMTDTIATLRRVVGMVGAMRPAPAFIVVSGDITNLGDVASYRLVREIMAGLSVPVVWALGNHDTRPGFYAGMLDRQHDAEEPYCHDLVVAGIHLIVLDTSVRGRISGALCESQYAFLDAALRRETHLPKIVVQHHAPLIDEERGLAWESLSAEDSRREMEMLRSRNVAGVLTGHVHHDRVSLWHGIPVVVGTGQHNANDVLHRVGLRMVTGASFGVCTLRESGLSVSFVPLPSERRELVVIDEDVVRGFV